MCRRFFLACALAMTTIVTSQITAGEPPELLLWPADHLANQGTGDPSIEVQPQHVVIKHSPSLLVFLPEKQGNGSAVMICPGGGYGRLAIAKEGTDIAKWMNERGMAAFVLNYRCGGGVNQNPAPLDDALRGMQLIRSHAKEWNIDPAKVGVMGFSAGGHLASTVSTLSKEGNPQAADLVERLSSRPNFSVLVYPVISMEKGLTHGGSRRNLLGKNPEPALVERMTTFRQVTKKTPPTFLVHASDDRSVPVGNSLRYYEALVAAKVPAELHAFEQGGHGFGMLLGNRTTDHWPELLERWLQKNDLMK